MANASDVLVSYKPQTLPTLPGSMERYNNAELQRISVAITELIAVVKALDAKQVAHGW